MKPIKKAKKLLKLLSQKESININFSKNNMPKISNNHEYVLDTSVLKAAVLNYSAEMKKENPGSMENYDVIHEICFVVLSELIRANIALDTQNIIKNEYESEVLDLYPTDYPAQWYSMMERYGKVIPKDITIDNKRRAEMRRFYGLSKVDCCLIHVAEYTSSKQVLHRDNGISNASGYAKKYFGVTPVNVMKI
jgi:hypothetical protein